MVHEIVSFNASIYSSLDKDFVDYRPYVSNTTTTAVSYVNNEDGPAWVSVNLTFREPGAGNGETATSGKTPPRMRHVAPATATVRFSLLPRSPPVFN